MTMLAWMSQGALTRARWRPCALAAGGAAVLAGPLAWRPFPRPGPTARS